MYDARWFLGPSSTSLARSLRTTTILKTATAKETRTRRRRRRKRMGIIEEKMHCGFQKMGEGISNYGSIVFPGFVVNIRKKKNIFARTFFIDFLKHVSRISAQNTLRIFTYSKNTTHYIPHGTAVLKLKASQNLHSLEVVLFPWSK